MQWEDVYKKKMENFPVFCPIWNFSDLQYFSVIHQKRVRHLYNFLWKICIIFKKRCFWCSGKMFIKKTLGNFSSIMPYLKLFGLAIFFHYSSKACKTSFYLFFMKNLYYFQKKMLLVQWKDVYKKNTWKFFQYYALFETFRTCNIFPLFIKSV